MIFGQEHLPVQKDLPLSCSPTPATQSRKPVYVPLEANPVQMESIGSDPIVTGKYIKTISEENNNLISEENNNFIRISYT